MNSARLPDRIIPSGQEYWIREGLLILPNLVKLYLRLLADRRVPTTPKVFLVATVSYVLSPLDILPDIIPFFGQLDELLLISLGLHYLTRAVGPDILLEHWDGSEDVLEVIAGLVDVLAGLIPRPVRGALESLLSPSPTLPAAGS